MTDTGSSSGTPRGESMHQRFDIELNGERHSIATVPRDFSRMTDQFPDITSGERPIALLFLACRRLHLIADDVDYDDFADAALTDMTPVEKDDPKDS